ncbi:amino acid ABC transporter permease [Nocardia sp. NPDC057668]|uniref:amino acid ABC transporter permease n=1 Tax=Nocardia sp. NPDC057668 TaxID=3346202 RepID=UPI003671B557
MSQDEKDSAASAPEPDSAASAATVVTATEPEPIKAIPLRRPGRWLAAAIILILLGLFLYGAATNPAYHWDTYRLYLRDSKIASGALVTLELTVLAMAIGVVLGVLLAVMRLSPNPVLRSVAWVYLWIFRGTPVYVQLVFWGLFPSLYKTITLGVPFGPTLANWNVQDFSAPFVFAVIGLGLNEAAYMAEIVRAGIGSVGDGQREASTALGMSWSQTMTRTVLPQAMRVIIPPTGNELISMLKTTSLVTAIPLTTDLYGRARDIYGINFQPIPLLLVAATWYLAITSVLMVGQFYLERYYSRGSSRKMTAKQLRALASMQRSGVEGQ